MKYKRKNHSVLFRGLVLVVAFALAVLCAPIDSFIALASMQAYTDYSYMTIGKVDEEVSTSIIKGKKYYIPNAYIGGDDNFVVGKVTSGALYDDDFNNDNDVTLLSSNVTVKYSSMSLEELNSTALTDQTDITNKVVVTAAADNYGYFVADKLGTYTITYSYKYNVGGKDYTNSYELKVESELSSASIDFEDNNKKFIPSVIDLNLAKIGDGYKNLNLPLPTIIDEDGDEVENVNYVTDKEQVGEGHYVLITANGGVNSDSVEISGTANEYYISGDTFKDPLFGDGKYTIKYAYYLDGEFVASTTKSTQVYAEGDAYYEKYDLRLELTSDWNDNGQTGVESTLPAAKGVTAKTTSPASEEVDVYYTVKVYYKSASSDKGYELISAADYNTADETIVNADGTLANPTKFKPLKDGYYSFEYTVTDFYGKSYTPSKEVYEFTNIKDEQNPTPIVYDASSSEVVDASAKMASRSVPNSVVVYAIGMEDNVSKAGDEKVELSRKIMTDETVSKLTITDYDQYNLVFNYRNTATNEAYVNLLTNNYLIRKQASSVDSDTAMLNWLKEHKYLIVVDNANAETIYNIFNAEDYFDDVDVVKEAIEALGDDADEDTIAKTKKQKALAWLKSSDSTTAGFAYLNVDETFGATTTDKGMGSGQYYIHYIAKDAAGNEKDLSKSMYIGSYEDNDAPKISFPTTLSDSYLPSATVSFDVPTVSDNYDTNMVVKTMYRFLKSDGVTPITVNPDGESLEATNDLAELWEDLTSADKTAYQKYHSASSNDGYIDLTDTSVSSYKIDLSQAGDEAVSLQIVVYTYDDKGNASIYGETINISNTIDNAPPQFKVIDTENGFNAEYEQGQEIELPSLTVLDDAVSFMSFDVNVYYVNGDTKTKVATYDYSSEREILSQSGAGKYTVNAGKFVASFAGEYQASIAVKDSNNKTIVSFVNYTVKERNIVQPPVISTSLENKTVELDGDSNYNPQTGIEIPTPSVSYQIPNSVTYDKFYGNEANYGDTKFVVLGVNENGKATNWSTTYGQQGSFKPTAVGEYPIVYTVNLTVYNHNTFTYQEMGWDDEKEEYVEGGFFTFTNRQNQLDANVVLNKDGNLEVTSGEVYTLVNTETGVEVHDAAGMTVDTFTGTVFEGVDLDTWFDDLKTYTLTSDVYTIVVKDTKGPVVTEFDYVETISNSDITSTDGYKLNIYGIEGTDASGINTDKSKIVLSWKLANGDTGSQTFEKQVEDTSYTIKSNSGNDLDGTYTITYTVYDNNNNYTTKSYTIAVGDNIAPTLTIEDDFVEKSYEIGTELRIDPTMIKFTDNRPFQEGAKAVITLKNTSTDEEITYEEVAGMYVFKLETIGTYSLTVEIEDAVGNTDSETFSLEVSAKTVNTANTYQVVGTVLIVISVLVLAGVIVYFVVSKVKLDKELKK